MGETDSTHRRTEGLRKELAELEKQLASLKAALPVHSLSPAMFQQLDDLEYQIKQKRAALEQENPQSDPPSNE